MSRVELRHLTKTFDGGATAVDDISLTVDQGEFVVFLGPSGCGKTTTLRMIAGFEYPTQGQILIGGEDVTKIPPRLRQIGMVFQNYALFPTMSVAENVAFGLRQRGLGRAAIESRVEEMLRLAQLSNHLREAMQVELRQIQRRFGITTVLVTHDQQEAMSLADRIVVMNGGRIQQLGMPSELYEQPNSQFVAEFVGKNNIFTGVIKDLNGTECVVGIADAVKVVVRKPQKLQQGETIKFGLRPEHITMSRRAGQAQRNAISGTIEQRQYFGNRTHYFVALPWRKTLIVEQTQSADEFRVGEEVVMSWEARDCVVLGG